jgi:hypothetical protein
MADTTTTGTTAGNAVSGVVGTATGLVAKGASWIDQLFSIFGVYTANYSKYIVYGLLILAISKVFKFKFNINTGGRK